MTSRDRTLAAIVDTFVPAADGLPSASELGVHTRLLEEVAALGRPSLQNQLDMLLRAMGTRVGGLALIHRAAGAKRLIPLVTPPHDWRDGEPFEPWLDSLAARSISANRILLFTAHQMSSCRIGTDPRRSVAGPDGQVHGVPGLYVTDASALPTATGVNPVLSLMALARRTALGMAAR